MSFIELFLSLFSVIGLSIIVIHGEIMTILGIRQILDKWEFTKKLTHCSMCLPVWLSPYAMLAYYMGMHNPLYFYAMTFPFAVSAITFLFERLCILVDDAILLINKEK